MADLLIANPQHLEIHRGDDKPYTLTVQDEDGALVDISNYEIRFTAKRTLGKDDAELFQLKNVNAGGADSQIKVTGTGLADIFVVQAGTNNLDTSEKILARYDVEVISDADPPLKTTIRWGNFTIFADATRPES